MCTDFTPWCWIENFVATALTNEDEPGWCPLHAQWIKCVTQMNPLAFNSGCQMERSVLFIYFIIYWLF